VRHPTIDAVAIVVPVRDEAALLGACLAALSVAVDAAADAGIRCETRIVLDACTDSSREIAESFAFRVLTSHAARVGAARRTGVEDALRALRDVHPDRIWIASTDADSRVPPGWLISQHAVASVADLCIGTVRPDFADLAPAQQALWSRTHRRGDPNGHVHGANLGVRASTYLAAGGFAPLGEHEDVDLVARCRSLGAVTVASDDAEVITSGRTLGRTPGGYAGFLRRQAADLAQAGLEEH
jgi:glycosyltransferase involved in cell wall biosynthesis